MSKMKTKHLLAARHKQAGHDSMPVLVANLETKKYVWEATVQDAMCTLKQPEPRYNGSKLSRSVLGWLKGSYPEGFTKIVLG